MWADSFVPNYSLKVKWLTMGVGEAELKKVMLDNF